MIRRFFLLYGIFALGTQLMAMPDISGNISDTTWTKANSPYHITGNTNVSNLTIEPGVEVLFDGDFEFNIDGDFAALGSKSDTIRFRPNTGNSAGYHGLHVLSTAQIIEFDYCRIEGANNFGIKVENSLTLIQNSKVLSIDGYGVELSGSSAEIRRSVISDNSDNGIDLSNFGRAYISNSRIMRNNNSGINSDEGFLSLTNCIISHNSQGGITLLSSADTLEFVNCTIAYQTTNHGIAALGSTISGLNSIIYHNNQSVVFGGGSVNISFSDIKAPYSGGGSNNRNDDPDFTNTESMRLSISSPCIDDGNPDENYNDKCFPPSLGTAVNDMGAYGGPGACHWFDQMVVIPETLDFGIVTVADVQDSIVIVKNYRDSQLDISEILIDGPDSLFFDVTQSGASIAPFDSLILPVSFSPDSARIYQASLIIIGTADSMSVPLSGEGVTPTIIISATKLDFDQVRVGTQSELDLKITNFGQGALHIRELLTSNSSFSIPDTTLPLSIASVSSANITVIFNPDSNLIFRDTLLIISNDPQKDSVYIDLVGEGTAPVLTPSQSVINFSKVLVSGDSVQSITISNTGQDSLFISNVQIINNPSGSFKFGKYFASDTLSPGVTSDTIEVSYLPKMAGIHNAVLQLSSNDPFNDPYTISLSGQGVKPVIDISGQNFAFGEVTVGDSTTETIWIKNTGDTTLFVNDIEIDPDHAHFSIPEINLPLTIESGDSSDVFQITYAPKTESTDSITLTITSNDPDYSEIDTLVTGTGVIPILTTIPDDSLLFGEIVVDDSLWRSVILKNTGSGTLVIDTIYISGNDSTAFDLPALTVPINLGPEDSSSVAVKFSPESQGVKNANLYIISNDPDVDTDSIALSGTGVVPQIHLSPNQIDFDPVYIGYSDSLNLDVSNTGGGILQIDNVVISDNMNFSFTRYFCR